MAKIDAAPWRESVDAYLNVGQWADGIALLFSHLETQPDDIDALLLLGDCYLAGSAGKCACACYERIQARQPQLVETRMRLANELNEVKPAAWVTSGQIPNTPDAVHARLSQKREPSKNGGGVPHTAEGPPVSLPQAEAFIESILTAPDPALVVRDRLPEVITVLPVLLDLAAEIAREEGVSGRAQTLGMLSQIVRDRLAGTGLV